MEFWYRSVKILLMSYRDFRLKDHFVKGNVSSKFFFQVGEALELIGPHILG